MDCPPQANVCIDSLYEQAVTAGSGAIEMPGCLGEWRSIPIVDDSLAYGSYGYVYEVWAKEPDVVATVMQGGRVVAKIRAPGHRAWECVPDKSRPNA